MVKYMLNGVLHNSSGIKSEDQVTETDDAEWENTPSEEEEEEDGEYDYEDDDEEYKEVKMFACFLVPQNIAFTKCFMCARLN